MESYNNLLNELENVLRSFKLVHFDPFVLFEFPETSWAAVGYLVKRKKMLLKSSCIAKVLTSIVENYGLQEDDLADRIAILRILSVALNGTKEWHCFNLLAPNNQLRLVTATTLAPRVGRTLSATIHMRGIVPEVHSIEHVDSYWFSVSFRRTGTQKCSPSLYFVTRPGTTVLFASRKPSPSVMEPICKAIGYDTFKDAKLKGKDLTSLYRVLEQGHNVPISQLNELPIYSPVPELTPTGIDYTHTTYNERYVDDILGDNPPLLHSLEIRAVVPFSGENGGMNEAPIRLRVKISSRDSAKTLKEMVKRNVMKPDAMWLNFFRKSKRNQVTLSDNQR